jgi:small-conductance mechanosensitive channel
LNWLNPEAEEITDMHKIVQHYVGTGLWTHIITALLIFLFALVAGWIVIRFLTTIGRRIIARTKTELDDKLLDISLPHIRWLSLIVGLSFASEEIADVLRATDVLSRQILLYVKGAIYVAFVITILSLVVRIVSVSLQHLIDRHDAKVSARTNEAVILLIRRIVNIVVVVFALISIFTHFGIDVSSLLVFLGGGSVALALAAQDMLSNMIAGFVIMLDRPFRVGDRIQLPSGETGDVYEIGIRSTKILDFDNNLMIIPNSELTKSRITNFSFPQDLVRVVVDVGVAYGTELDRAKMLISEIAKGHPDVMKDPIPEVFTVSLGDSSIGLRLVARTDDYRKKFRTETALREQVYRAFMEAKIEIPFPQRVVHISNPANVKPQGSQKRKTVRR